MSLDIVYFNKDLNKTGCQISLLDAKLLFEYAKKAREGCILEIGSGKSTIFLGLGSLQGYKRPVYTIDIWRKDLTNSTIVEEAKTPPYNPTWSYMAEKLTPIYEESWLGTPTKWFCDLLKKYGIEYLVVPVADYSEKAYEKWKKQVDTKIAFLFIDGDHRYYFVKKEVETWGTHVIVGGHIFLHDIGYMSVKKVSEQIVEGGQFKKIRSNIFRRIR